MLSILMSPLLTQLACQAPIEEEPTFLQFVEVEPGVGIRTQPSNIDDAVFIEIIDNQGFAITTTDITLSQNGSEKIVDTDAFGAIRVDSNTTSVAWNDLSIVIATFNMPSIPDVVGYRTQLIPSTELSTNAELVTDGALYSYGSEIWWLSQSIGAQPHFVGSLPSPVLGVTTGHLDGDGIIDAVAYSAEQAVVLRGRPYGGFTRLHTITPAIDDLLFYDARIAQLNSDQHGDFAVALSSSEQTVVSVFDGDGAWTFDAREPLSQSFPSSAMMAMDEDNDQLADITLIDDNLGAVRRYSYSIEGWIGGFPSLIDPSSFTALPGAEFGAAGDINGDGNKDILIYDGEGVENQDLIFFTIGETITKYSQSYAPYYSTLYDVDGNGTDDIFSLSNKFLHLTYYDDESSAFSVRNLNTIQQNGPLQARDFDGDGLVDIRILAEQPILLGSTVGESGKWTPKNVQWKEDDGIPIENHLFVVGNADNDPAIEIGAIISVGGSSLFKVWEYNEDFTALTIETDMDLGSSFVSDLKLHNGLFYLINDNGNSKRLRKIQLANGTLSLKKRLDIEQDYVECTTIAGEDHFLLWGGVSEYAVVQSNFVAIDGGDATGWNDADIGVASDGATQDVRGCSGTDCQVEFSDLNGDGIDELILRNGDGISITGLDDVDITLPIDGFLSSADLNNDDAEELLIHNDQWTWMMHFEGARIAATHGIWIEDPTEGRQFFVDVNQDGILETIRESNANTLLTARFISPQ